jgi:hypothetical protein
LRRGKGGGIGSAGETLIAAPQVHAVSAGAPGAKSRIRAILAQIRLIPARICAILALIRAVPAMAAAIQAAA